MISLTTKTFIHIEIKSCLISLYIKLKYIYKTYKL